MTRELLQQALEALEHITKDSSGKTGVEILTDIHEAVETIRDHLAQPQGEPAWHDAPTVPGLWVVGSRCLHINELDLPIYKDSRCRWYGPIPEDKP